MKKLIAWKQKNVMTESPIEWVCLPFSELSVNQLFDLLKLRQNVFILEQTCLFPDIEDKDKNCHHLLGYQQDELVAVLRIVPPNVSYTEPSLGRIATARSARKNGTGRWLMQQGIQRLHELYSGQPIRIGAQYYLKNFYASFGFEVVGDAYDEDGIMHIEMLLSSSM